jgi:DNA-binding MarR family transcriptional regulator
MGRDLVDTIVDRWRVELPAVAGIELELSKRSGRLFALLGEAASAELVRLGLTKAEYEVLAVLRSVGEPYRLRPTDLTTRLTLSSGGTSNVLRRLTETGLVERELDSRDARSSWVRLTPTGVKLAEEAVVAATEAQKAALDKVPRETIEAATHALRELLLALGDHPPPAPRVAR